MRPLPALLILLGSAPAFAAPIGQAHHPSPALRACLAQVDAQGGTQADQVACAHDEWLRRDGELNRAYGRIMALVPSSLRASLRDNERGWLATRDSVCQAQRQSDAGQAGALTYETCMTSQTLGRLNYLGWVERHRRL